MRQDTLGQLMHRPRHEVAAELKSEWSHPLSFARSVAEKQGLREEWLTSEEVYYAMATALAQSNAAEPIRFVDRIREFMSLSLGDFTERLSRPLPGNDDTSPMSEFLWSVACESRPTRRLANVPFEERAAHAYEALRARFERNTRRFCGHLAWTTRLDAEEVANDAWSRAYEAYWSSGSTARFIGQSRASTLIYRIAYNIVVAATRSPAEMDHEAERSDSAPHKTAPDGRLEPRGDPPDPPDPPYMSYLTPRQKLVFQARFVEGRRSVDIARELGTTPQSVANHVSRGKARIRQRLGEKQRFPRSGSAGEI